MTYHMTVLQLRMGHQLGSVFSNVLGEFVPAADTTGFVLLGPVGPNAAHRCGIMWR